MKKTLILIIDDEPNIRSSLAGFLADYGYAVNTEGTGTAGIHSYKKNRPDIVLLDVKLPDTDGVSVLKEIFLSDNSAKVIMMSGEAGISTAVEAIHQGALNFLEKPLNPDQLLVILEDTVKRIRLEKRVMYLEQLVDSDYQIIGNSHAMLSLKDLIEKTGRSESRVLIYGENGSGKELVARALHSLSSRKSEPFVSLNCAAIPDNLVESELFGHEKGAFTGAYQRKKGRIEEADGGTLFLDEIGDMGLLTQAKMLRVLETSQAVRVGGNKPYSFDVRIISATNKNLEQEIKKGSFREDLFYRLNVVPIYIPPLRERKDDIPLLLNYYMNKFGKSYGTKPVTIDEDAVSLLRGYCWPGNVRELKNVVERLLILSDTEIITADVVKKLFPDVSAGSVVRSKEDYTGTGESLKEMVSNFEYSIIKNTFEKYHGNVSKVAKALQTDRANLYRKLKSYGIK